MKLIDPEDAKEYAETALADPILQMAVRRVLDNAPGVEIVRCKECKHRHSSEFCECRPKDGYCNDGERK